MEGEEGNGTRQADKVRRQVKKSVLPMSLPIHTHETERKTERCSEGERKEENLENQNKRHIEKEAVCQREN